MIEENEAAKAEGEALPASTTNKPADAGFFSSAEKVVKTDVERAIAAVEAWYAKHFHAASTAGRNPITSDEKAALVQSVADAVAPTKE